MFLDANVLLEILLGRQHEAAARRLIEQCTDELQISALTAHLVVHFGQTIVALPVVRQFLADYTILGLESADFQWALTNIRGNDFEDALQLAIAIRNGCALFSTFDQALVSRYADLSSIRVQSAA
jgi:predicted nucleic acid-binding protein